MSTIGSVLTIIWYVFEALCTFGGLILITYFMWLYFLVPDEKPFKDEFNDHTHDDDWNY